MSDSERGRPNLIATGEFDARVVKVTSAGVDADYGRRHNEVRLYDNGVIVNRVRKSMKGEVG